MRWARFLVLLFPLSKRRRRERERERESECTLVSRHVYVFKLLICLSTERQQRKFIVLTTAVDACQTC